MSTLNTLTPIQHEIVGEISRILEEFGATSGLLSVIGSWGDTLPEDEILLMLKQHQVYGEPVSVLSKLEGDVTKDAHESMQG